MHKFLYLLAGALGMGFSVFSQSIVYKTVTYEFAKGGSISWLEITAAPNPVIRAQLEQRMKTYILGEEGVYASLNELKKHAPDPVNPLVAGDVAECENVESQHSIELSEAYGVASLTCSEGGYFCGAHGSYRYTSTVFEIATGKELQLTDVFKPGYETVFTRLGEQNIRGENQVPADQSLEEYGYFGFSNGVVLAANWVIDSRGITFVYNPYEVGPWSMPPPEFTLDFDEIKDYIRTDGPLAAAISNTKGSAGMNGYYQGRIGSKYEIVLFVSDAPEYVGWYYYKSQGETKKINLVGTTTANRPIVLTEYIDGKANGVFTLEPKTDGTCEGTWKGNKGNPLPVILAKP